MALQEYTINLKGDNIHNPDVELESYYQVVMIPGPDGWSGKAKLDVSGNLEYLMKCQAISGTTWKFIITNESSGNDVVEDKGETGEKYPNMSRRFGSVNPA